MTPTMNHVLLFRKQTEVWDGKKIAERAPSLVARAFILESFKNDSHSGHKVVSYFNYDH